MRKTTLAFGLISGAISSLMMVATVPVSHMIGFDKSIVIGYTSIVLSFMLVFFGIRSYRDNARRWPDYIPEGFCRRDLHHSDIVHLLCGDVGRSLLQRLPRFLGQIRRPFG